MPKLEYALLCDYVRPEAGVAHVLAANIDTMYAAEVPVGRNIGLLALVTFADDELDVTYPLNIVFRKKGGDVLAEVQGEVRGERPKTRLPDNWQTRGSVAVNFGIYFPEFGIYSFDIYIGERTRRPQKTVLMRVERRKP